MSSIGDQLIALSSQQVSKVKGKHYAEGTSRKKKGRGVSNSIGTLELWAPKFVVVELGKKVMSSNTSKDHETCFALGNVIMLSQDLADLDAESTEEFKDLLIMQGVQVCRPFRSISILFLPNTW